MKWFLQVRAKGDAERVTLAARLRAETTLTVGWIAERWEMGTRGHLNQLLLGGGSPEASSHYQELTPDDPRRG